MSSSSYEYHKHNMRPTPEHIAGLAQLCSQYIRPGMLVAEIGCFAGTSAQVFCDALRGEGNLFCVDGWETTWTGDPEIARMAERDFDLFVARNSTVTKIKAASAKASTGFADGLFDLVYIDAAHGYPSVRQDINLWKPKVKPGGVLSGHDYGGMYHGVKAAVDEVFDVKNIETFCDYSWAVHL